MPALKAQTSALAQRRTGSEEVCSRGLVHPSAPVANMSDWGGCDSVVVRFRGNYKVAVAFTGQVVPESHKLGITVATVQDQAGAVGILKASKATE